MAVAATNSTSATDLLAKQTANATDAAATSDRFLKLLVAQMKNQDPLSPMDNAAVTSQMAQINTVSGIEKLNATVASLSAQFLSQQTLQGASLIGHDVIVPGNQLNLATGSGTTIAQGGYELAAPVDAVKVEVLNGANAVVDTLQLGAQSTGLNSFSWTPPAGVDATGFTFKVTATAGATPVTSTALMKDRVTAVNTSGTAFNLELAKSGTVAYKNVREFN